MILARVGVRLEVGKSGTWIETAGPLELGDDHTSSFVGQPSGIEARSETISLYARPHSRTPHNTLQWEQGRLG